MRDLDVEWGQLQLEQSTWAGHARIEKIARDKLGMRPPPPAQIVARSLAGEAHEVVKFASSPILSQRLPPGVRAWCCCAAAGGLRRADRPFALPAGVPERLPAEEGRVALRARDRNFRHARPHPRSSWRRAGGVDAGQGDLGHSRGCPADARAGPRNWPHCWKWMCANSTASSPPTRTSSSSSARLPPDVAEKVAALHLPGIHEQNEYRRYYPSGDVMAHVLGFTGVDDAGQEGVELAMNDQLTGKPGSRAA